VGKTTVSHPLAEVLIQRLSGRRGARVLEFASGSGRNVRALQRAQFDVVAIDDAAAASSQPFGGIVEGFAGAISTHGLLHGTRLVVERNLGSIANLLERGGVLAATFGSTRDARFGTGERIDDSTFAPVEGDERGVAHAYFDCEALHGLLLKQFDADVVQEQTVDDIAGKWAHRQRREAAVHWFVVARRR
jgi:hypothetical protein